MRVTPDSVVDAPPAAVGAVPSGAMVSDAVPSNAVPSNVVPSNVVPSNVVPSNVVPSNVVPSNVVPSNVVPSNDMALRILAATAVCVAGQGLRATSIDDIAEAAGCARATIYRIFPGGRAGLLAAAAELQITTVLEAAGAAADDQRDLVSALTAAVHAAATGLAGHAALQRLLAEEPGAVLPFISFDRLGPLLAQAAVWGREHFRRFLSDDEAEIVGEWVARVVLVHLRSPGSPTDTTDLPAVGRVVEQFLLPGLAPLAVPRTVTAPPA